MQTLLEIQQLKTYFFTRNGLVKAIDGIDFTLGVGETLALVGESGCGKSMTALSIMRLVPEPGRIVEGRLLFRGEDLRQLPEAEMRRIRGNKIAMIFQEPMTSLNPVFRIGRQIVEVLRLHKGLSGDQANEQTIALLRQVGISAPESRIRDYPHQLSGGMRQRVMIAMALACDPRLLIADEPTTALDVTIQAQIMHLLAELKEDRRMGTLLISHDLGVVAENADRVAIMYAGLFVEVGSTEDIYHRPQHPYTKGLLACRPRLDDNRPRLEPIKGQLAGGADLPPGCSYLDRCPEPFATCGAKVPPLREIAPGHLVRCWSVP